MILIGSCVLAIFAAGAISAQLGTIPMIIAAVAVTSVSLWVIKALVEDEI